jgi:hypothetical protein
MGISMTVMFCLALAKTSPGYIECTHMMPRAASQLEVIASLAMGLVVSRANT